MKTKKNSKKGATKPENDDFDDDDDDAIDANSLLAWFTARTLFSHHSRR